MCVRSNLPLHTLESQMRDTNGLNAIREQYNYHARSVVNQWGGSFPSQADLHMYTLRYGQNAPSSLML